MSIHTMAIAQIDLKLRVVDSSLLAQLRRMAGVRRVRQTFHDEEDDDLRTLFVVDVDAQYARNVLAFLRVQPVVVYAEPMAPRKVIGDAAGR